METEFSGYQKNPTFKNFATNSILKHQFTSDQLVTAAYRSFAVLSAVLQVAGDVDDVLHVRQHGGLCCEPRVVNQLLRHTCRPHTTRALHTWPTVHTCRLCRPTKADRQIGIRLHYRTLSATNDNDKSRRYLSQTLSPKKIIGNISPTMSRTFFLRRRQMSATSSVTITIVHLPKRYETVTNLGNALIDSLQLACRNNSNNINKL